MFISENQQNTKMNKGKRTNNTQTNLEKKKKRITGNSKHFAVIPLNINGLSSPIKRYRLADCIRKQD
jgi:hypothetical protein